jgi:regulator of sigma E protease
MSWNFVQHFSLLGNVLVGFIIPFLFVLTIIVFFHELGHFLVARWCGIRVLVFSIGFGPELVGFNDRHGTRWKISAVPLGGYVKFFGDDNAASVPDANAIAAMKPDERKVSFFHKSVGARIAVVAAGPIANFLLAIAIFATIFTIYGKQEITARVANIVAGSAAEAAGFKLGDLVLSINGRAIETFRDMQEIVSLNADEPLDFLVDRGGAQVKLIVGRASTQELGGPLRIAQMSGQAASLGFTFLMNFAGLISVSIGLLNLFPIPLLDGGHLLFYTIEALRGRPLSERVQEVGFRIGFAIIVMLMIFTVWIDVSRWL